MKDDEDLNSKPESLLYTNKNMINMQNNKQPNRHKWSEIQITKGKKKECTFTRVSSGSSILSNGFLNYKDNYKEANTEEVGKS